MTSPAPDVLTLAASRDFVGVPLRDDAKLQSERIRISRHKALRPARIPVRPSAFTDECQPQVHTRAASADVLKRAIH